MTMIDRRRLLAVLLAGLCGGAGCRDAAGPLTSNAAAPDAATVFTPPQARHRTLGDMVLAGKMLKVARDRAARGDSASRRWLEASGPLSHTWSYSTTPGFDPDDPSTWGTVEIRDFIVVASLVPGYSLAGVGMDHNGHIAEMTVNYDMKYLDGRLQYHYGPNTTFHANLNGPWGFTRATNIVEVEPPAGCGNRLEVVGDGKAYWVLLPLPSKIGPFTVPNLKWGQNTKVGNASDAQPACAEPPPDSSPGDSGDSGGGSSGGGYWLTVTQCDGYDYYEDGIYLFSTIESCTSYAVWVDAT